MTCKINSVILVLMGTALLGLVGCESQPYKPWQSTDSWWDKDDHADKQAEMTKAAEQATAEKQVPAYTPVKAEEPAQMRVSPPVTDAEPYEAPASMVTMEPEPSRASGAGTPARTTGDVLLIDSIQSTPDIRTPRNGMSMESVRRQFGNPLSEGSSIGDPPITRWEYKGFSVYFEHDLVLHSVTHRPNRN